MKSLIVGLVLVFAFVFFVSAVLAQDFCEGNFDHDDDQDGSDAFTFKTDFGRSSFGNPCPPNGPAPVPQTGQMTSYNLGDDGDFERGVEWPNPRFISNVDNNGDGDCNDVGESCDGTVTDNLTGLIWLRDANCSVFSGRRTWEDALNIIVPQLADGYCQLTDGSSPGDWRLPNYKELFSLVDAENFQPVLPSGHPFTNVQSFFWSSSTCRHYTDGAWYVNMDTGYLDCNDKPDPLYAWPVRGGH